MISINRYLKTALLFFFLLFWSIWPVVREDNVDAQVWGGYITSYRINPQFSLWNDWHYVPGSFFLSRHGLTLHMLPELSASAGYAAGFLTIPGTSATRLNRQEHRPWGQLAMRFPLGKKYSISHRIRYDARFREAVADGQKTGGYLFNHRVRFMTSFRRPLTGIKLGEGVPFVTFGNEMHLNLGENILGNNLDQNRTWLMFGYQLQTATFQFGYLYRFIPTATAGKFNHFHTATLWVTHIFGIENAVTPADTDLLHRNP